MREGTTRSWQNMVHDYEIYCDSAKYDLIAFLHKVNTKLYEIAIRELKTKNSISIQLVAIVDYIELNISGEQVNTHRAHFRSTRHIIINSNAIKSALTSAKNEVLRNFNSYKSRHSKYKFSQVIRVDILSDQNNPLRGGNWVRMPGFIISKKCCINVKNLRTNKFKCPKKEDLRCFEYGLEIILNPVEKNGDRPLNYNITKYEVLNMEYPVNLVPENIEIYENFINKSINIYKCDENESLISLYYRSQNYHNKEGHINLLLYKDHIAGIKNLSALLRGQIHRYTNHVNICMKCHKRFESESDYNSHIEYCVHGKQNIELPSKK